MEGIAQAQETAPIVDVTDLNAPNVTAEENPLEVRWAFNAVCRDKPLRPRNCGYSKAPYATFFPVKAFETPREFHSLDWTQEKERMHLISASDAQASINFSIGDGDIQSKTNWGVQFGFFGMRDAATMLVISKTLCPSLSHIRAVCADLKVASPISEVCEGTGSDDFEPREECPTCMQRWLHSDALQQYIDAVIAQGMTVKERDPKTKEITERLVQPTRGEFDTALVMAKQAHRQGIKTLQDAWAITLKEYEDEKQGRKGISDAEQMIRKDLHQIEPKERQLALIREAAGGGASNDNTDVRESLATLTDNVATLTNIVGFIAQGGQNAGPDVAIPPVEVEPVEDVKDEDSTLSPAAKKVAKKRKK